MRCSPCINATPTCVRRIAPCADATHGRTEALLGRCCKAIEMLKRRLAEREASVLCRPPDHEINATDAGVQGGIDLHEHLRQPAKLILTGRAANKTKDDRLRHASHGKIGFDMTLHQVGLHTYLNVYTSANSSRRY